MLLRENVMLSYIQVLLNDNYQAQHFVLDYPHSSCGWLVLVAGIQMFTLVLKLYLL